MELNHFETIDELIKAGKVTEARTNISRIDVARISRTQCLTLARLCRRVGWPLRALRILSSFVRSQNQLIQPTDAERVEYAAALSAIGGGAEAIRILEDPKIFLSQPQAYLTKAIAHFTRWEYEQAVPLLEAYVRHDAITGYPNKVGRVNLIAALVITNQIQRAKQELEILIPELLQEGSHLLAGNCYELLAQVEIQSENYHEAERILAKARQYISEEKMPDILFVKKWEGVTQLATAQDLTEGTKALLMVYERAKSYGHWETMRDIDFLLGKYIGDPERLQRVYFGTPIESYRRKILAFAPQMRQVQKYNRSFGDTSESASKVIDLSEAAQTKDLRLEIGSLSQKLFSCLIRDYYKPTRIPTLFSEIYQNEFFDPDSSVNRISVALNRLRKVLEPHGMQIQTHRGGVRLIANPGITLIYPHPDLGEVTDRKEYSIEKLKGLFVGREFSCEEAAHVLKKSPRTVLRLLEGKIQDGQISKSGVRSRARYQFKKAS